MKQTSVPNLRGGAGSDAHVGGNGVDTADYTGSTGFLEINLGGLFTGVTTAHNFCVSR